MSCLVSSPHGKLTPFVTKSSCIAFDPRALQEEPLAATNIVTLTTDFGAADHFAGCMRGVILGVNPTAHIVDLCNAVNSFDVLDGAMTIAQAYRFFPPDCIHLVVIDPGVGSSRRPLLVTTSQHYFIAPDNGVLSLVMQQEQRISVRHITAEHYFLHPISNTFHGRDIFAPCAGWLSRGVEVEKFGPEITDYVRFSLPKPKSTGSNSVQGVVLKADKFGNLITNLTPHNAPAVFAEGAKLKITVGQAAVLTGIRVSYAQGQAGELFGLLNSMGMLEIACNRASAAHIAQAARGTEVVVEF
jgi:S-adenosylmethionine hydrolase